MEKIDQLLRAGMAAPSACDKQPWHFIAIGYPKETVKAKEKWKEENVTFVE